MTLGDVLTAAILRHLAHSLPNTCHQHEPSSEVFILRVRRVEARRCLNNDSEEYRIHCLLLTCTELCQAESFLSMIPTLRIVPSPHNFSFVVMPRHVYRFVLNAFSAEE